MRGSPEVARAAGRCYGAMFFSVFGAVWLLLGSYAFTGRLVLLPLSGIVVGLVSVVLESRRGLRRAGDGGDEAFPEAVRRRNDSLFWAINAVQGVLIFAALSTLPRLGHQDLAIAVVAGIVGLHFFPMPPLYRYRANLVTGAALVLWALGCAVMLQGDRMIAWVALGCGLILFASAVAALNTANQLLRFAGR